LGTENTVDLIQCW